MHSFKQFWLIYWFIHSFMLYDLKFIQKWLSYWKIDIKYTKKVIKLLKNYHYGLWGQFWKVTKVDLQLFKIVMKNTPIFSHFLENHQKVNRGIRHFFYPSRSHKRKKIWLKVEKLAELPKILLNVNFE